MQNIHQISTDSHHCHEALRRLSFRNAVIDLFRRSRGRVVLVAAVVDNQEVVINPKNRRNEIILLCQYSHVLVIASSKSRAVNMMKHYQLDDERGRGTDGRGVSFHGDLYKNNDSSFGGSDLFDSSHGGSRERRASTDEFVRHRSSQHFCPEVALDKPDMCLSPCDGSTTSVWKIVGGQEEGKQNDEQAQKCKGEESGLFREGESKQKGYRLSSTTSVSAATTTGIQYICKPEEIRLERATSAMSSECISAKQMSGGGLYEQQKESKRDEGGLSAIGETIKKGPCSFTSAVTATVKKTTVDENCDIVKHFRIVPMKTCGRHQVNIEKHEEENR